MAEVAAPKPKTVKPKGEKKETTKALIKESIVALKVGRMQSTLEDVYCEVGSLRLVSEDPLLSVVTLVLQERSGSSPAAIKKYLAGKGKKVDSALLGRELKKLVAKGYLVKVRSKSALLLFCQISSLLRHYNELLTALRSNL